MQERKYEAIEIGELLDEYLDMGENLFRRLGGAQDAISDYREFEWNGDPENPEWDQYGGVWVEFGDCITKKNGLVFVYLHHEGEVWWGVFSEDKIK